MICFKLQLWFLLPRRVNEAGIQRLGKTAAVLHRVQQKRASKPTDAEWEEFVAKLKADVEPLLADLANDDEPVTLSLRWAVQHRLPNVLKHGRFRKSHEEIAYANLLLEARRQLDKH
jgi:hypothetical protein